MINSVMSCLQKGRNSLIVPKKRTIEELQSSRNLVSQLSFLRSINLNVSLRQKSLQPALPNDLAISFYVQSHKLICAVYFMQKDPQGQTKFDIFQVTWENLLIHHDFNLLFSYLKAETSVPWLSEVLVLFTVALQFCQQLKDKVSVFTQYKDMQKTPAAFEPENIC